MPAWIRWPRLSRRKWRRYGLTAHLRVGWTHRGGTICRTARDTTYSPKPPPHCRSNGLARLTKWRRRSFILCSMASCQAASFRSTEAEAPPDRSTGVRLGFAAHASLRAALKAEKTSFPGPVVFGSSRLAVRLAALVYVQAVPVSLCGIIRPPSLPERIWVEFIGGERAADDRWFQERRKRGFPARIRAHHALIEKQSLIHLCGQVAMRLPQFH